METPAHCQHCRAALQPGAKFCVICGEATSQPASEIERRQLTLLFCGLVGASGLAERLDPEDFRDLLASYQAVCRESVRRHEGHVSQFLGDGVMAYFGFPIAHEDDAVGAIRAALGILEGIKFVNGGIGKRLDAEIHVRSGLHSGTTVVGELGPGGAHDRLAVGETVNLAARIQSSAAEDTVVISASTAKLVRGYFDLQSLGHQRLKGFTLPVELFRVLGTTGARSKLEAATRRGLTPHVGREKESAGLADLWKEVHDGGDRVVVVRGEPGIGKSRIVHDFRQTVLEASAIVLECFCSPLTQATAFAPLIEMLDRRIADRARANIAPQSKLDALRAMLGEHSRFEADALPLMAALLSVPGVDEAPISALSPVRRRTRTLETLRDWAVSSAERLPLALFIEDAHWADPSTLDFLDLMVGDKPGGRTLVCVTARPEFGIRWSGLHVRTIELPRLSGEQIGAMVTHLAGGRALPHLVERRIAERSEGVPLFVEEVTKAVLESGALRIEGDRYELLGVFDEQLIPTTVHASLLARFDRLGASKGVAQLGAAIGREFTYRLIRAVAGISDDELQEHLDRLCRTELAFAHGQPPDAAYVFKHALIQDAVYGTLLKSERSRVHEHIFSALRDRFPELIAVRPEMAAYHAETAGQRDAAVPLLRDAGLRALGRTAVAEAVKHLGHAIELVDALDEPDRTSVEMELQAAIGPAYMATVGWSSPEVERSTARLRHLAVARADGAKLFQATWGLWSIHFLRGQMDPALDAAKQVFEMALAANDPGLKLEGYDIVGYTQMYRGEYVEAIRHAESGLALFDLEREKQLASLFQIAPSVGMWSYGSLAHWMLGLREKSAQWLRNARRLAEDLRHPPSLAYGHCAQLRVLRWMDEVDQVRENAVAARALSAAEGFAVWVPMADIYIAWSDARRGGDAAAAVAKIRSSISIMQSSGNDIFAVEDGTLLAETILLAGKAKDVFPVAERVLSMVERDGYRHCGPELLRLQGEACRMLGERDRAAAFFHGGVERARAMGAKSLELRSVVALARMGCGVAERAELRRVLDGFTDGFEQVDIKDALALIHSSQPERPASLEFPTPR
jgi:predicted ATPase/class 3 adenylate cyclase